MVQCCTFVLDLSQDVFRNSRAHTRVRECTIWKFLAPSCFVALVPVWDIRMDMTRFPGICVEPLRVIGSKRALAGYR